MLEDMSRRGTWLLGSGLGSSTIGFSLGIFVGGGVGVAHNEYLRLLYETGIVGVVVSVLSVLALLAAAWRSAHRLDDSRRWIGAVAVCLVLCYAAFGVTDNVIDYYNVFSQYPFFATGAAVAMAVASRRVKVRGSDSEHELSEAEGG
jgi:O-antigen ligase